MSFRILSLALVFALIDSASLASDKPIVHACCENEDSYPWLLKDRPGLTIQLLQMVEKQIGSKIEVVALPWKRCMDDIKNGSVDAAFKLSYSAERAAEFGNYPMLGDKPDPSKRLLTDSYNLYRLKGASVEWDGKTIKTSGKVGAQAGFSVVTQLKALGVSVDDGSRSAEINLEKLVNGRFVALALQTNEADTLIQSNVKYRGVVEKINPVLVEKPYFLIFSKAFTAKNPNHVKEVWDAIGKVRESSEYMNLVKTFH